MFIHLHLTLFVFYFIHTTVFPTADKMDQSLIPSRIKCRALKACLVSCFLCFGVTTIAQQAFHLPENTPHSEAFQLFFCVGSHIKMYDNREDEMNVFYQSFFNDFDHEELISIGEMLKQKLIPAMKTFCASTATDEEMMIFRKAAETCYCQEPVSEPAKLTWKAYPNPTTDYLYLDGSDISDCSLSLTRLKTGDVLFSELKMPEGTSPYPVDLTSYPVGLYILTINQANHKVSHLIVKTEP